MCAHEHVADARREHRIVGRLAQCRLEGGDRLLGLQHRHVGLAEHHVRSDRRVRRSHLFVARRVRALVVAVLEVEVGERLARGVVVG